MARVGGVGGQNDVGRTPGASQVTEGLTSRVKSWGFMLCEIQSSLSPGALSCKSPSRTGEPRGGNPGFLQKGKAAAPGTGVQMWEEMPK